MWYNISIGDAKMPLAVLQQKLNSFPEEYFDEINNFFDLLSYKVTVLSSQQKKNTVTPGLAQGKWKYPKKINAFDEDIAEEFEAYL